MRPLLTSPSATYLPTYMYRGGKQRTRKFSTLPSYIPNFTLISDLASDLGVTSGYFRGTWYVWLLRPLALFSGTFSLGLTSKVTDSRDLRI